MREKGYKIIKKDIEHVDEMQRTNKFKNEKAMISHI
jgi:hypothetical protein